jgi:hypothetical protein
MIKWISKIAWWKVFQIGAIYTVIAAVVHTLESMVMMKWYQMPEYFGVWSKLMMPKAGPPPAEFFITSTIGSFMTGISLCAIYYYLKEYLPKNETKRILFFADLLVATSFIFFTVPLYLLINIPPALLGSWFVSGFILNLAASALIIQVLPK